MTMPLPKIVIRSEPAAAFATATAIPYRGQTDEETAALSQELHDLVGSDRYPFSPRIQTLKAILGKLRPEPTREPLPPLKVYAPPRFIGGRRRRG
jgi:hypothetical protein